MSADNGIYILATPARPLKKGDCYINRHNEYEYRVAYASAIDNLDYSDLYIPLYFGDSEVFSEYSKARERACLMMKELEDKGIWTEYGLCFVEKDITFPNMSSKDAAKALDSYVISDEEDND